MCELNIASHVYADEVVSNRASGCCGEEKYILYTHCPSRSKNVNYIRI